MKSAGIDLHEQMVKKLDILQKISTNTKIQIRFIQQRKMKGLLRLLRERAQYFQKLAVLNAAVHLIGTGDAAAASGRDALKKISLLIDAKQQEIIQDNRAALETAAAEKIRIMADLQRVRFQRRMRKSYDTRWVNFTGKKFNQKG